MLCTSVGFITNENGAVPMGLHRNLCVSFYKIAIKQNGRILLTAAAGRAVVTAVTRFSARYLRQYCLIDS